MFIISQLYWYLKHFPPERFIFSILSGGYIIKWTMLISTLSLEGDGCGKDNDKAQVLN